MVMKFVTSHSHWRFLISFFKFPLKNLLNGSALSQSKNLFIVFFKTQSELNEPVSGSSGGSSFLMFLSQPPS